MAAIGIQQLKSFNKIAKKRQKLAKQYDMLLSTNPLVSIFEHDYEHVVPHIYVIRIVGLKNRAELQRNLLEEGIQTGSHYMPNHLLSFYKQNDNNELNIAEKVYPELLTLPLHFDLNDKDIEYIIKILLKHIKV